LRASGYGRPPDAPNLVPAHRLSTILSPPGGEPEHEFCALFIYFTRKSHPPRRQLDKYRMTVPANLSLLYHELTRRFRFDNVLPPMTPIVANEFLLTRITQIKKQSAKSVKICVICVKQGELGTGDKLPLKQSPFTNPLPPWILGFGFAPSRIA
jgi:hypothetical protein